MPADRTPDVIVGIDFGHDSTKVALALTNSPDKVIDIIDWTQLGKQFEHVLPKTALPTAIAYSSQTGNPILIGARSVASHNARVFQGFKLQALSDGPGERVMSSRSQDDERHGESALTLCRDYLTMLRGEIARYYNQHVAPKQDATASSWHDVTVDVMLSIPGAVGIRGAQVLAKTAREAGFQTYDQRHLVHDVSLTEPEAAVLQVFHETGSGNVIENGNTVLLIDIGASTSDTAIQAIADKTTGRLKTDFMQPVSSDRFGGSYLDKAYWDLVKTRLLQHGLTDSEANAIQAVVGNTPQYFEHKSTLGRDLSLPQTADSVTWAVSGEFVYEIELQLDSGKSLDASDVHLGNKTVTVKNTALARLVDDQIFGDGTPATGGGIQEQVRNIVEDLVVRSPSRAVSHRQAINCEPVDMDTVDRLDIVVFCGGFCKMPFARDRLEAAIRAIPDGTRLRGDDCDGDVAKCLSHTRYLLAQDPQLCVCKGLVLARQRELAAAGVVAVANKSKRPLWGFIESFLETIPGI